MTCKNLLVEIEKRYDFKTSGIKFDTHYVCTIKQSSERTRLELLAELLRMGLEKNLAGDECPFALTEDFADCPFCNSNTLHDFGAQKKSA
jgi:hypothetical protein